jgi:hypothetical protein
VYSVLTGVSSSRFDPFLFSFYHLVLFSQFPFVQMIDLYYYQLCSARQNIHRSSLIHSGIELLPVSRLSHDTSVRQVRAPRMLRVTVKQDEVIPAKSQKVVPCQIQGRSLDNTLVLESAVETTANTCQVAHSVADGKSECTQVRLLNPTNRDLTVKAGQHVANASAAQVLTELNTPVKPQSDDNNEVPLHLRELFEETCDREQLNEDSRDSLRALLCKHASLFAENNMDLGRTSVVVHDIDTGDSLPIRQPPRRPPTALQPVIEKEVQAMLRQELLNQDRVHGPRLLF